MNFAACGVSLIGQKIGVDSPITIIQMLWVNIIMDTLGGLAFAGEPPLHYYMHERPKRRDEPILSREMLHQIFLSGVYTLALCTVFLTSGYFKELYGYATSADAFLTAFYVLFIFAGIFNCFAARSERLWMLSNIDKNKPFVFIMLLICSIQIMMIYFGGSLFRCIPLSARELGVTVALAFSVIPFDIIRRIVYKLK
jgi:magnesium-transporting ATPase (P-type)